MNITLQKIYTHCLKYRKAIVITDSLTTTRINNHTVFITIKDGRVAMLWPITIHETIGTGIVNPRSYYDQKD